MLGESAFTGARHQNSLTSCARWRLLKKLGHRTINEPEDSHPPAGVLQIAAAILMADQLNWRAMSLYSATPIRTMRRAMPTCCPKICVRSDKGLPFSHSTSWNTI